MNFHNRPLTIAIACMLALTISVAAADPIRLPEMGDPIDQHFSLAQERELGQQMMREVRLRLPLLADDEINAYLRDLGQRLASYSGTPEQEFNFFVVNHPAINAFAMPGGHIGVNTGLILAARSESEVAGVLAHEIAHVTQRHIARGLIESQRVSTRTVAMLLASIIIASQDPEAGSAAAMAGVAGSIQQQLNFSREHEHEADRIGMRILRAAGLDPQGMPRFFERLLQESRYRGQPPEWLSTHPLTANRVADTYARAGELGEGEVFESDSFGFMQARLRVLNSRSPDEAVAFFRGVAPEAAQNPSIRYGLALGLTATGQFPEAAELLDGLLRDYGEDVHLLLARAELDLRAGNSDKALQRFQLAHALYPQHEAVHLRFAEALLATDRHEQARQLLARGLSRMTATPRYYWLLAQAASGAGRSAEARLAMAEYYYLQGELRSALAQLDQVSNDRHADQLLAARASARAEQLRAETRSRQAP